MGDIAKEKILELKQGFERIGMKTSVITKEETYKTRPYEQSVYDKAIELGLNSLEAKILSSRLYNQNVNLEELINYINPTFKDIMDYKLLKDMDIASKCFIKNIKENKKIVLLTDYDCDGVSSACVLSLFLRDVLKYKNFVTILNYREFGNGINDVILNQTLTEEPNLVITADHGEFF